MAAEVSNDIVRADIQVSDSLPVDGLFGVGGAGANDDDDCAGADIDRVVEVVVEDADEDEEDDDDDDDEETVYADDEEAGAEADDEDAAQEAAQVAVSAGISAGTDPEEEEEEEVAAAVCARALAEGGRALKLPVLEGDVCPLSLSSAPLSSLPGPAGGLDLLSAFTTPLPLSLLELLLRSLSLSCSHSPLLSGLL